METQNLPKSINMIVVVGITLLIGMFVMAEIGDSTRNDVTYSGTDSSAFASFTGAIDLDILSTSASATCSNALAYNTTDDTLIVDTGNYTISNCEITVTGTSDYDATAVYVNYSYSYDVTGEATAASNASEDMVTGLSNGTGWIAILIVVMFAVIILGMLSTGLNNSVNKTQPVY